MKKLILLLLLIPSLAWGQTSMSGVSFSGCATGSGTAAGCTISDDFSSDTTESNYYAIRGAGRGINITGGALKPEDLSKDGHQVHVTTTGSNNHCVSADITSHDADDNAGLALSISAKDSSSATGYIAKLTLNDVALYSFSGATKTSTGLSWVTTWAYDATKNLRVCVNGDDFSIWVNGVPDDENPKTVSSHTTGQYIGTSFEANGTSGTIDNLKGDAVSTCME